MRTRYRCNNDRNLYRNNICVFYSAYKSFDRREKMKIVIAIFLIIGAIVYVLIKSEE